MRQLIVHRSFHVRDADKFRAQAHPDHAFRFFMLISEMKRPQDAMKVSQYLDCRIPGVLKDVAGCMVLTRICDRLLCRILHRQLYLYWQHHSISQFLFLAPHMGKGVLWNRVLQLYVVRGTRSVSCPFSHESCSTVLGGFTCTRLRRSYSFDSSDILNMFIRTQSSVGRCGLYCASSVSLSAWSWPLQFQFSRILPGL